MRHRNATMKVFGAWLSLVERLVRDQEVQSSNLCAPTKSRLYGSIGEELQNPSLSPNWIILGSRALVIRPRFELPNSLPGGFQLG